MNEESRQIIEKLKSLKPVLRDEMGVTRLRVYGSVARGEAKPSSDIDLIVDFERPSGLFDLFGARHYIEDAFHRDVDLSTEMGIHKALRDAIVSEARDV